MSGGHDEEDEFDDGLFYQLVEYRTRFYENLANDALTLLSIQLFILPITISIFSLLIQVISEGDNSASSSVTKIVKNVDYTLFRPGAIVGMFAIFLTVLIYHFSRREASKQPNLLLQRYFPGAFNNRKLEGKFRWRNYAENVGDSLDIKLKEHFEPDSYHKQVKKPFSDSDEALWRASFTVALSATLGSTALLLISFIKSVYLPVTDATLFFIRNAMVLLSYFAIPAFSILAIEWLIGRAGPTTTFITNVVGKLAHIQARKFKKFTLHQPVLVFLFLLYFLLVGSSSFFLTESSGIMKSVFITIGLLSGITGSVLFLINRVNN